MSLSFFLRSAHRTVFSSLLPAIRYLGCGQLSIGNKFHSLCDNRSRVSPSLLETRMTLVDAARGMKTKGKLNRRCKDCYLVIRQGRRYIMCKTHPRHKQQAMVKKEENTWILTHATQSKKRPW